MPVVVILDNVRSLNNIGSIFRTCDAFRVSSLYLCGITATPPHRDIQKTALGATESVEWFHYESTLDAVVSCRKEGFEVCALEQAENSIKLNAFPIQQDQKYALVFGHEMRGVDQEIVSRSDRVLEIPQSGTKHSLNIAVSAGIVLWDFYKVCLAD